MKQRVMVTGSQVKTLLVCLTGLFILACEPVDSPEYFPEESPIKQGTYKVTDTGNASVRQYEMGIRWKGGKNNRLELCNFSDGRMSAVAFLHEDQTFIIPAQTVRDEINSIEVIHGNGVFTEPVLTFHYWGINSKAEAIQHKIEAIFSH